mmetsp:Transcript_30266/g.96730  ORF Transcript_30266/g.96730 Transcript_30266/m.96730 type:complete len:213 (+) Transcript_30266:46-684(+)
MAAYDAVRAVADAVLASSCATRVGTSMIAAAVRAALSVSPRDVPTDAIDELVDDRLEMIRPVLRAQTVSGLACGRSPHNGKTLVSDETNTRANVAKHAGFDKAELLSKKTVKDLKKLQRGKKTEHPDPLLSPLVGTWSSVECPKIQVIHTSLGTYATFTDGQKLERITERDGVISINNFKLDYVRDGVARWHRGPEAAPLPESVIEWTSSEP